MNKIGEINLENQIKIMDAFDFIEQFTAFTVSNIKEGLWNAFSTVANIEDIDIEEQNNDIPNFYVVEHLYFEKFNDIEHYNWEKNENIISIEKGVIGIYNDSLDTHSVDNYYDDLEEAISSEYQDGIKNQYLVCPTPYGNDGNFSFDTIKENGKIVAIRIVLKELY